MDGINLGESNNITGAAITPIPKPIRLCKKHPNVRANVHRIKT